jgi:phage baseplate assembly protein gpV
MYQEIDAYLNKDGEVVYIKDVNSLVFTGTVTDIVENEITIENADEDEYTFKTTSGSGIDFMFNGVEVSAYDHSKLTADEAEVTVVLEGESGDRIRNDKEVLAVIATQASGYVQVEEEYVEDEVILDVIYLPEDDDEVDFANLKIEGDATALEDIEKDDVLTVYVPLDVDFYKEAASKMTIVVSRNTVEGKVTRINSAGDVVTINGTSYDVNLEGDAIAVADEGIFYLDHAGRIFAVDTENTSAPEDYALVLGLEPKVETSTGRTLADAEIKLLTASGEKITYVLDDEPDASSDIKFGAKDPTTGVVAFDTDVDSEDLIKYNVNKDGEVDNVEKVEKTGFSSTIKTDSNSFNLASNVVIFNVSDGYEDAEVVDVEDLDDEISAYRIYDSNKIVVLIVTDGVAGEDGIFAVITKDTDTAYDEDEDKPVKLFTAYVDGKKVEYLAHKDYDESAVLNQVVELTLKGGKLESVSTTSVTGSGIKTASSGRVSISISAVDAEGETTDIYYLSDDVVVYVMEKNAAGEYVFDSVGSKSDIRNSQFQVFDTDDDDNEYEIVFVYED